MSSRCREEEKEEEGGEIGSEEEKVDLMEERKRNDYNACLEVS